MLGNDPSFAAGTFSCPAIGGLEEDAFWLRPITPGAALAAPASQTLPELSTAEARVYEDATKGLRIRCETKTGIVEIVDPRMLCPGKETFCRSLSTSATSLGNASRVDLDLRAHRCRFQFEPNKFDDAELTRRVVLAIEAATLTTHSDRSTCVKGWGEGMRSEPLTPLVDRNEVTDTTGSDRCLCLALGSGSLMAALAGLILPGIPTAPFLLYSAHYFLRSSRSFRRWLEGMPWLSELLRRLEAPGGMAIDQATIVKTLCMAILFGLVLLVVHPPLPLVLAIELGLTIFLGLHEIDGLDALFEKLKEMLVQDYM